MKKKYVATVKSIALLFYFAVSALSAQDTWHKLTGFNDANAAVWMSSGHNNLNYAITADRWIYYSGANAASWQPFATVPSFYNVGSILASKVNHRVFCLTSGSGIAYTDNLGQTWQNTGLGNTGGSSGFGSLVLAYGLHGTKMIAATIGPVTGEIQNNLFLSTNNGSTFSLLGTIPFYPTGFHFLNENSVVSNTSNGIFKTTNINASAWASIGFSGLEVTDLDTNGTVIYASVKDLNGTGNVYKSEDAGENWTLLSGIPPNTNVTKIAVDWSQNRLFATTTSGVHAFMNNSWTTVSPITKAHEIVVNGNNSVLFCGVRVNGVHKIASGSFAVEQVNEGLLLPADFMVVSVDNQIYTGSAQTSFLSRFNLDDLTWNVYNLFDDIESTRILSMGKDHNGQCVIGGMNYIARTQNQGETVSVIADNNTAPPAPVYNLLFPQKMFLGNNGSLAMVQHQIQTYVDYSPDMGNTWDVLFESVPGVFPGFISIEKVCTGTQSHFIMGLSNQTAQNVVITSTDNGVTWMQLPGVGSPLRAIYMDREDTLYGVTTSAVFRWNPAGQNWVQLPVDLGATSSNKVTELAFDNNNKLYLLNRTTLTPFAEEGIYVPDETGEMFIQQSFPIVEGQLIPLKNLTFAGDNIPIAMSNLESGNTENGGFYYYHDSPSLGLNPTETRLIRIYPNPARDKIYVHSLESEILPATLTTLTGQHFPVVIQHGQFNVSSLAAGIYVLQFEFQQQAYRFKVVLK